MPDQSQLDRIEGRFSRLEAKLDVVLSLSRSQLSEAFLMSINLDALTAKVTQIETVDQSALTLLQALADEVRATPATQSAIDALATRIDQSAAALAAAVVANTPSTPAPTPDPVPAPTV